MEKTSAAGSVSVIGGANGPTSVFIAGKSKDPTSNRRCAVSSLHYQDVEQVEWRMIFQIKDEQTLKVSIM
jgi:Na+-transporting methylmalonyl-CoA/oxaloacetate decarboxylase beta subunit